MNTRTLLSAIAAVFAVVLSVTPADAQSQARSIESFNRLKPNWEKLVGSRFRLEGRYALYSSSLLKFKNCDLSFRPNKNVRRPRGQSRTIEVSGRIAIDGGKLYFAVDRLAQLPSDRETFNLRKIRFREPTPDDFYGLAEWARQRARFYEDKELAAQAESAYLDGIHLERKNLTGNASSKLFDLAAKVKQLQLPDSVWIELLHEANHLSWQELQVLGLPKTQLIERIAKELPFSTEPLPEVDDKLRADYFEAPISVYRNASADQRKSLQRFFFSQLVMDQILQTAKADGSNGRSVAEMIEQKLPEMPELAASFRGKALDYRLANVASVSRQEMQDLAQTLRDRGNKSKSQQAVTDWLAARERLLRKDGPEGLLRFAREVLEITGDEPRAVKLLIEAEEQLPNTPRIVSRLELLGFVKVDDKWQKKSKVEAQPVDEIHQAMRDGVVVVGMTADQVRQTLGRPNSISRIVTAGNIAEVWIYGEAHSSRLVVQLSRQIQRPEAKVVGISQVAAKPF